MFERPLMWDNVQSAGHHCKINPDRVTPAQSKHNLHLIPSWHLNWKSVFVQFLWVVWVGQGWIILAVFSTHWFTPLLSRFTCRTRLVIAWVLAYISFYLFHLEVMRTMSVNLTCVAWIHGFAPAAPLSAFNTVTFCTSDLAANAAAFVCTVA